MAGEASAQGFFRAAGPSFSGHHVGKERREVAKVRRVTTNARLPATVSVSRCQIDHRSSHTAAQPSDRTGKIPFQQSQQGERLAAIPVRFELPAASPQFCVAFLPNWPIEIWYGEELTQY